MRKLLRFFLTFSPTAFLGLAFLVFYFSPGTVQSLKIHLNNSDLLFPFSVYRAFLNPASSPDWVFGGYTPFPEVIFGYLLWLLTHNTQLTLMMYAVLQPVLVMLCLLYLVHGIVGRSRKLTALVIVFSALPILVYSAGLLRSSLFFLFSWYLHITTTGAAYLILGALLIYTTHQPQERKIFSPILLLIFFLTSITVLSDPIFLSQFIAPAIAVLMLIALIRAISIRRAAYAGLTLLYGTAAGLAMYQLPRLWGSDRLILYGSYLQPVLNRVLDNLPQLMINISNFLEGQYWPVALWLIFYLLCLGKAWSIFQNWRRNRRGHIQVRLLMVLVFLPVQMLSSIGASLIGNDPSTRYFNPAIFMPLFWGWPLLLIAQTGWLKRLDPQKSPVFSGSLVGVGLILLLVSVISLAHAPTPLPDLTSYYPQFTACLDQNASRLGLRHGIAQYWQARQNTVLSKTGLVIAQVTPDLAPLRILNNSDAYNAPIDFVIIDNQAPPSYWIDRQTVLARYGDPATTFTCENSDILVYNRPGDLAFRQQFAQFLANGKK